MRRDSPREDGVPVGGVSVGDGAEVGGRGIRGRGDRRWTMSGRGWWCVVVAGSVCIDVGIRGGWSGNEAGPGPSDGCGVVVCGCRDFGSGSIGSDVSRCGAGD
jgi:hypothetical protein